jgi:hypothetical protein
MIGSGKEPEAMLNNRKWDRPEGRSHIPVLSRLRRRAIDSRTRHLPHRIVQRMRVRMSGPPMIRGGITSDGRTIGDKP